MAWNRLLAIAIALATVAFAVGVSIERSDAHSHSETDETHVEATSEGEGSEAGAAAEHLEAETGASGSEESEQGEETLLGIDVESTPLVAAAVLVSLALAAAVWLRPELGWLLDLVVLAMLLFAVLDIREVFHQAEESESGLAVLAAVVALLHLTAAGLAFQLTRSRPDPA